MLVGLWEVLAIPGSDPLGASMAVQMLLGKSQALRLSAYDEPPIWPNHGLQWCPHGLWGQRHLGLGPAQSLPMLCP